VISEGEIPRAVNPLLQHAVETYASEINKTASVFRQFRAEDFPYRPHPRSSSALEIFRHQLLSERRFFGEFLGTPEPDPSSVPPAEQAPEAYAARLEELARPRLAYLAGQDDAWWIETRPFIRCGAATDRDFLETGTAFGSPPDAVDRLSAAARQACGFDLRTDCRHYVEGRRSYTWLV
jgi:hypothetical protein